jgi:outer membrane protein TolC
LAAGRGELAVASLGLQQVLNVDYPVDVEVVGYEQAIAIGLSEAQCLDVAQGHRADLEVNRLLVQFSEYGRRIAKARTGPQVSVSGLFGRGAENFDTEDLLFDNEWFVGLEVTYPWGLNPVKSSSVAQDRIPTAGQTESTEFLSHTLGLDLFAREAYALRSERQAAEIEYAKAMDQWLKTQQSMAYEVREGYTNYRKTLMQLDGSRQRVYLGEEQVKISRAMASLNEIPASDVLKSQVELADSQVAYLQALADHHTAVAALNKAVGIPGYFH